MATFVNSQRGGQKLIYQGFIYTKNCNGHNADGTTYWRCELYRTQHCHGCAILNDNGNVVNVTKDHNHAPSPNRIELAKIKNRIKQAASTSNLPPRTLVNQQLAGISDQAKVFSALFYLKTILSKASLPKMVNLEKSVNRKRRADGEQIRIPHSLAEINIPDRLRRTKTAMSEEFVLADTGHADQQRIMVFGSRTDVSRLASCDVWLCDGTFWAAPDLFYQLWVFLFLLYFFFHFSIQVIHGRFRQSSILPLIYVLLPGKTRACYERALD